MVDVEVEREIQRDADVVWALLADFGNLSWVPGVEGVETSGEGVGMTRLISVPILPSLQERLDAIDHRTRVLEYSSPLVEYIHLANYVARVQVEAKGPGRCTVRWHSRADAHRATPEEARALVLTYYEGMLGWLEDHFEQSGAEQEKR